MTPRAVNPHLVLDALGHQTRRDILDLLYRSPLTVVKIANQLPVSRPAVSKHLRFLEKAELVSFETQGASRLFSINAKGFVAAARYLEPFWEEALVRFKQIAETAVLDDEVE